MKKYPYAFVAAGALLAAGSFAMAAPAEARDRVTLSFSIGDVAFGYHDGYYDRNRRWHRWQSDYERDWYRRNYGPTYYNMYRDRDRDRYRLDWRHGRRSHWSGGSHVDFALVLGNVVIAYDDGYYDRDRRWHRWQSSAHRDWYRLNRRDAYFAMRRDLDRDRYRRDWWEGRRSDWRYYGQGGYDSGGQDFTIVLGNVAFAYSDGYYGRDRRWHAWRSDAEREWYRRHYSRTYYDYARNREISRARQEWRERRKPDWYDSHNNGYDRDGDGYDEDYDGDRY